MPPDHVPPFAPASPLATDLLVFSRGLDISTDGCPLGLSDASAARVKAALAYVAAHVDVFRARRAAGDPGRIVFSGGWAAAAADLSPSSPEHREGRLMHELAHDLGVDGVALATLVDTFAETESTSTLENVLEVVDAGFLADRAYTAEHPLGLVAHAEHMARAQWFVRRALGLRREAIRQVIAVGEDKRSRNLPEPLLYVVTRVASIGATTPQALARRERLVLAAARGATNARVLFRAPRQRP